MAVIFLENIKVIFLDFDGVLNSKRYFETHPSFGLAIDSTRLDLLKKIVLATNAKIVLSTSWREHWNKKDALCDNVGREINRLFAGKRLTIFDKISGENKSRYEKIVDWLKTHPNVADFVVLDDAPFEKDILKDHFVLTSNLRDGLDEADVEKAIRILNGNNC